MAWELGATYRTKDEQVEPGNVPRQQHHQTPNAVTRSSINSELLLYWYTPQSDP